MGYHKIVSSAASNAAEETVPVAGFLPAFSDPTHWRWAIRRGQPATVEEPRFVEFMDELPWSGVWVVRCADDWGDLIVEITPPREVLSLVGGDLRVAETVARLWWESRATGR